MLVYKAYALQYAICNSVYANASLPRLLFLLYIAFDYGGYQVDFSELYHIVLWNFFQYNCSPLKYT